VDGDTFRAFVVRRRPELLRTALLLTGDRVSAEALVQRTLTGSRRRWRRLTAGGDPTPGVRAALVTATTGRWARLRNTEQVLESPAPGAGTDREAARVLRELPPLTRAVVVLRWHEELPAAETARVLGRSPATVTGEAAAGLARLTATLPPAGYERAPAAVGDEDRLRDQLVRLATPPGPWQLDAAQAVTDVELRRRVARRRWAGGLVAAACVAGVAVPLARAVPLPEPPPTADASVRPSAQPPPIAPRSRPVLVGPTRGSLAGDPAFLDAVRRVGWGPQVPPALGQRDVVFAGDTPDGRVVLVTGTVDEDFRGVWLTGPVGAAPGELAVHVPPDLGRDRPLTLVLGGPGPATLVVVAGRNDRIEVSERLQVGPRGTVGRTYTPVDAPHGVAVVPVGTTVSGTGVSVRVSREGRVVHRSGADRTGDGLRRAVPLLPRVPLRPVTTLPDDGLLAAALTGLAVPLGVEPAALEAELVWSGALPGARPGTVAVLLARSPGGALVVSAWVGGGGAAMLCGVATPPGTADVAGLTVARVCEVTAPVAAPTEAAGRLVLSAPPAGVSAEVLDARDRLLETVPLSGGGAVTALPDGAHTVRVLDAAGATVSRAPVAPMATEVFGDYGPGASR
jgi:DNA-directed RNA polymerase specialized sigma24 family protein